MIRLVWLTLLAAHIGAAGVWWWMMPGGFPSGSTAWWVNQVLPLALAGVMLLALFARGRVSEVLLPVILAAIPFFWMAFAISARLTFVESFEGTWNVPFLLGAGLLPLWRKQFRSEKRPIWVIPLTAVVACLAGWSFPGTLRAAEPATTPSNPPLAAPAGPSGDHRLIRLTRDAQVQPVDARLVVRRDQLILNVQPLLTFADRSPDRFWVGMAPPARNVPTTRKLVSELRGGDGKWTLGYKDEAESVLEVTAARDGALQLEARSKLGQPIWSHANAFSELTVQGARKLLVSFSPVPQLRLAPAAPAEPARFAYVDGEGTFHVMQASERQRGPFRELGAGKLARGEPLVLTLYDGDKALFAISFDDWAAQVATQLSPTAGDGVPANAIELARGGEKETTPTLITLSLAATTVGRGTQTVAHAAGVYRNRVTVRMPGR